MFRFTALLVLPVVLASLATPMEGAEIKIVSPSPWADVESGWGTQQDTSYSRSQQIFTADDFMDLPAGNRALTAFVWRPDGDYSGNGEWTSTDFRMRMSTTDKQVGRLSYTFADNLGADVTTVYEGDIAVSQTHSGPVGGPKDFDDPTPLQTPFIYDPNDGNLLVDIQVRRMKFSGTLSCDIAYDTSRSSSQYIWGGLNASSAHSSWDGGLVWQFTSVPVPESFTLTSETTGVWNTPATWDDGTLAPDEYCEATVSQHAVTVVADGNAHSLVVDDGGRVVIDGGTSLTLVNDLEVNQGTLEIGVAGTLSVGGEFTMQDDSRYICRLDAADNGLMSVDGDLHLAGTIEVQASGSLASIGNESRQIISTAGETSIGSIGIEPLAGGGHLGYGVFLDEDLDFGGGLRVNLFQAAAGDTNGDRQVNNTDLQEILGAGSFGTGDGWGWAQGDFNGDLAVNNGDLQLILATGFFGAGPYAAVAAEGGAVVVPEPAAPLLLLSGGALLLWWRRRTV